MTDLATLARDLRQLADDVGEEYRLEMSLREDEDAKVVELDADLVRRAVDCMTLVADEIGRR